ITLTGANVHDKHGSKRYVEFDPNIYRKKRKKPNTFV
ncbi:hypothetical protein LEP1GSC055_0151, partial [Leptospira borgpetersenii str. Brem 307]